MRIVASLKKKLFRVSELSYKSILVIWFFRTTGILLRLFIKILNLQDYFFLGHFTKKANDSTWDQIEKCSGFHPRVDVLVSLFNFSNFVETLATSLNKNKCHNVYYHLIFVSGKKEEVDLGLQKISNDLKVITYFVSDRISIYEAWNKGIKNSSGKLITNLNADDLRRPRSICFQANFMHNNPGVDVCFGDSILVRGKPLVSWRKIDTAKRVTNLKDFDIWDLLLFGNNKPHCAPMWRIELHQELGNFDESYVSSGDSEFWLRCLIAKKEFHKINSVLVAYYLNPSGLSSMWTSRGFHEWNSTLHNFLSGRYSKASVLGQNDA